MSAIENVKKLSAELAAADAAIERNRADTAELKTRAAALDHRHSALASQPPIATRDFEEAMAARFAADATASLEADELAQAAERRAAAKQARDDWETNVDLLDQARGKVADAVKAAEFAMDDLRQQRDQAWRAFVAAAHSLLVDQFRERFARLRAELLDPIVALAAATDMRNAEIVQRKAVQISNESLVTFVDYATGTHRRETLFHYGESWRDMRTAKNATIAAWRRTLGS